MQICYLRLYFGTETDFCHLLQSMPVRMEMDWNFFFSSFNDMPEEIFQKIIIMITVVSVPWLNLFEIFFITLQEHVLYDFSS